MKLSNVLSGVLVFKSEGDLDVDIKDITYSSNAAGKGSLFAALKGYNADGHDFVKDAYMKGTRAFILSKNVNLPEDCTAIYVNDTRQALSKISAAFYGHPSKSLTVIGITGTKGKTTVSTLLYELLNYLGETPGLIGTRGVFYGKKHIPTDNTTPESLLMQKYMHDMLRSGVKYVITEVSSQALLKGRVDDVDFDLAVFTNITPDHIGNMEHESFEDYLNCKAKLFGMAKKSLINIDDEHADAIKSASAGTVKTFAVDEKADYTAQNIKLLSKKGLYGSEFEFTVSGQKEKVIVPTPGKFSVYNALAVMALVNELGLDVKKAAKKFKQLSVPGRMEKLKNTNDIDVIIDYAHNGISMESSLSALKSHKKGRIICVFGSVGDKTKSRRRELALAVSKYADVAVITSDNPANEDPKAIIDEIAGFTDQKSCFTVTITDREKAIYYALNLAESGDTVFLAGKGDEDYQFVKGKKIPFSEREIVKRYFEAQKGEEN